MGDIVHRFQEGVYCSICGGAQPGTPLGHAFGCEMARIDLSLVGHPDIEKLDDHLDEWYAAK